MACWTSFEAPQSASISPAGAVQFHRGLISKERKCISAIQCDIPDIRPLRRRDPLSYLSLQRPGIQTSDRLNPEDTGLCLLLSAIQR
jgi:hypothetical protein